MPVLGPPPSRGPSTRNSGQQEAELQQRKLEAAIGAGSREPSACSPVAPQGCRLIIEATGASETTADQRC
eukprot:2466144-Pyramimonas_sp.AAC.1